jgi:hypothetical protein
LFKHFPVRVVHDKILAMKGRTWRVIGITAWVLTTGVLGGLEGAACAWADGADEQPTDAELASMSASWRDDENRRTYMLDATFGPAKTLISNNGRFEIACTYTWRRRNPVRNVFYVYPADDRLQLIITDAGGKVVFRRAGSADQLNGLTGTLPAPGAYRCAIFHRRGSYGLVGVRLAASIP